MVAAATKAKDVGGPFLAAAVFCDRILEDGDKLLSVIRIIDTCQLQVGPEAPPNEPSRQRPLVVEQNLLILFRTGDSPGPHRLKLVVEHPDGRRATASDNDIAFTPEAYGGANVRVTVRLPVCGSGAHWVDVILDGNRMTRVPLNARIERSEGPAAA